CGRSAGPPRYRDARTHFRKHGGGPVDAAGSRVERVDGPILRAGEDASAIDGRLGPQYGSVGEREHPLGRELGYVGGGESGIGGGLEARVIEAGSPTGPVGTVL